MTAAMGSEEKHPNAENAETTQRTQKVILECLVLRFLRGFCDFCVRESAFKDAHV